MPTTSELSTGPGPVPGYELLERIGSGGMGEVYLARQLSLSRTVAVKFLRVVPGVDPGIQMIRFRREAELMAHVSHPNIVAIIDFGTSEGVPYLVMEHIAGGNLRSRMAPKVAMPIAAVHALVGPLTRALECLHRNGILHRDLKPENILLGPEDAPKVADFGIAVIESSIGALTRTDQVLGSAGYVAPEQQYRLPLDERVDQYSLAAIFYEALTGQKPLGAFAPPSRLNPGLGPDADAALLRGLSEERDDRFPTIREFGEALEAALRGKELRARKLPRTASATLAILVILLGAMALLLSGRTDPPLTRSNRPRPVPGDPPRIATSAQAPAPARSFVNGLGMEMVRIEGGEFLMGSPPGESAEGADDEKPRHLVKITRPLYMGAREVTVAQFRRCIDSGQFKTEAETSGRGGAIFDPELKAVKFDPSVSWRNPGYPVPQEPDEPVVQVSWNDAVGYCKWLSGVEKRKYRLPTEAEWEFCCRAGTTTRWSMGDRAEELDPFAWSSRNAGFLLHPVGKKGPNPFGLYDMHGNAWEWCLDFEGPYPDAPQVDPTGPEVGEKKILRGGSWDWGSHERTRSASRLTYPPSASYMTYGFRVCSPIDP